MTSKIIIMDFATCEVHIFPYNYELWGPDGQSFVVEHHSEHGQSFKLGQCEWMVVDTKETENRLPIYLH